MTERWSDDLRSNAARAAVQADVQEEIARRVRALPPLPEPIERNGELLSSDEFAQSCESLAYRLRTFQRVSGEVARAYDAMIAEGGPDNAEAYARYKAAAEFATDLMSNAAPIDGLDLGT